MSITVSSACAELSGPTRRIDHARTLQGGCRAGGSSRGIPARGRPRRPGHSTSTGRAAGDADELLEGGREDGVRVARPRPRRPRACPASCPPASGPAPGGRRGDAADRPARWPPGRTRASLAAPAGARRAGRSASVFTRCAPLVSTSSGAPSASKIRLLAMAPTSQPSCAAAAAAVGVASGNVDHLAGHPVLAQDGGDSLLDVRMQLFWHAATLNRLSVTRRTEPGTAGSSGHRRQSVELVTPGAEQTA